MFLDAGFYFDVMEITPEAVGIHRFNKDNQKVVTIWLMSQTLEECCQGFKSLPLYIIFFFLSEIFAFQFHLLMQVPGMIFIREYLLCSLRASAEQCLN